jgi:hypothetical protein
MKTSAQQLRRWRVDPPRLNDQVRPHHIWRAQGASVDRPAARRDPDRDLGIGAVQPVDPAEICYGSIQASFEIVWERDLEDRGRGLQAARVERELEGPSTDHPYRLEDPVSDLKTAVGDGEQGLVGRLQPSVDPDGSSSVHAITGHLARPRPQ